MKKKKILASLVLSAMMVGTIGTSVSASTWKPEGTSGVNATGGQGSTTGIGVVQRERHEKLFLVALPTTARQYRFYADPTGNTLEGGDTFQFQREAQKWVEAPKLLKDAKNPTTGATVPGDTKFEIDPGRANFSNFVPIYNAGSENITIGVDARISVGSATGAVVVNDDYLNVQVVSKKLSADTRDSNYASFTETITAHNYSTEGEFGNWSYRNDFVDHAPTDNANRAAALAAGHAVQKDNTNEGKYTWEISLPAKHDVNWITEEESINQLGQKATKDVEVTLEGYNASAIEDLKLNEFKYPVILFALRGYADNKDADFWDKEILARLAVKWYIKNNSDEGPSIEDVITLSDLSNGNFVPVNMGNGNGAMNVVSSVKWCVPADRDPNGIGFEQELLGSQVTYRAKTASTGELVFDQMALTTLGKYESLNGATIQVIFSAPGKEDVKKEFILWVL